MEINGPAVEALAEPMEFWSYCSFIDSVWETGVGSL